MDDLKAEVLVCQQLLGTTMEEQRAKIVAHLQQQAVRRLMQVDLVRAGMWLDSVAGCHPCLAACPFQRRCTLA